MIPNREYADELVRKYNDADFHVQHARIVGGVLAWFASQHDPGREDYWYAVGALHDIDYERFPEEHCVKGIEILREHDVDEDLIKSAMSHGWGMTQSPYEPELLLEKILYACDELTGFIGAVALMRPSKSVADLEVSSVRKKFKQPSFAAAISREVIVDGAERLGWSLDELIGQTIQAMRTLDYVA
ncbi:MAG: hydrolase [Propionibacteriaceae bacterium]|nr:hydrolase [Propionibacteriaceae bacterium]